MRKNIVLFALIILSAFTLSAQSKKGMVEVLYFKANLCACRAKVCTAVGVDIKSIVEKCYPDSSVKFRELLLTDASNAEMVTKYSAKSQTLIIVTNKKKKEFFLDISDLVNTYSQNKDKQAFEDALKAKIAELKKMK